MNSNKKFVILLEIMVITFLVMSVVPVCGLNVSSADIYAYPNIVNPGDEITVTYSGAPGFELDWIAMYKVGDPNEAEYDMGYYLAGEKSGTLIFTAPDEPGDYEFRLFEDDGYTDITRSNVVRVQEGTTSATPPPIAEEGLVAHYPFDGDYKDYSGNDNDGIPKGSMAFTDAVLGKGASFDGKSWIEVSDSDSLDLSTALTFSVWLYKQDAGTGGWAVVFSKGDTSARDSNSPYALLHSYDGKSPSIGLVKNNYREMIGSTAKTNFSVWYLLTVTWDGADIKYYINGELKDTKEWVGTLPNSDSKLIIGSDPPGSTEYFRGFMDDLRIYDHALSGGEIKALYVGKEPSAPTTTPPPIDSEEVPVTVLTSSTILPTAGGLLTVESEDNELNGASLDIPARALTDDVMISIATTEDLPSDSPFGQVPVGELFVLEPSELTFDEPVTLTLPIPPGEETRNLYVGVWNDKTKQWDNLGGTIDGDFISVEIYHLSFYGIFYSGKSTVRIVNEQQLDETDLPITVTYVAGPVPPIEIEDGSLVLACRPLPPGGVQLKRDEFRIMELLPGRYHFVVSYPRPQPGVANSMWFTIPELQVGADDRLVDQTITIRDDGAESTDLFTALSINFSGRNVEPDTNFRPTIHIGADVPAGVNQAVLPVSQLETGTVQQLLIGPIKVDQLHREEITLSATVEDPEGSTLKYIWSVDGDPLSGIRTVNVGTTASGSRLIFDFSRSRAGTYTVYLTVYDDRGLFNEGRWTIVVIPNAKPYIDVVVDDRVVDFGRLDGQRRNNPMIPLWLGGIVNTIPPRRPNNHTQPFPADDVRLPLRLWRPIPNWGVYVIPPVQGEVSSSTELKRIVPTGVVPNNPTQYPQGMTCVYAIVADADADLIDAKFVLPEPIFFRGNFYTAIPLPDYPIGTLIDSYGVMDNYNAMLTEYANRGWLPVQPHNRTNATPAAAALVPFIAPIAPARITFTTGPPAWLGGPPVTVILPDPLRGEFPYVIAFDQSGIRNGSINPNDTVTEAPNPLGLIPQGTVYKVIVVEGSWDQGNAKGYLWMIPVTDDFWDPRHAPPPRVPTLFVNGVQKAICSYVGQTLPVIWEAPDDPDEGGQVRDRRIIYPDTIPLGGMFNIEARVSDSVGTQKRAFAWVAWPTPPNTTCESIEDQFKRDKCYYDLAKEKLDVSICDLIQAPWRRDNCYCCVAIGAQDSSICDKLPGISSYYGVCPEERSCNKADCYEAIAIIKQDVSFCDKIEFCDELVDQKCKDNCYIAVAKCKEGASICDQIKKRWLREFCYSVEPYNP
jgi:hypothetical protein